MCAYPIRIYTYVWFWAEGTNTKKTMRIYVQTYNESFGRKNEKKNINIM